MGLLRHVVAATRAIGQALLAWSYRRLYDELAWAYDGVARVVSGGRWRDWQRAVYPYLADGPVLEIGPGPGHLLGEMLVRGYDAYGLERSRAMLSQARRLLAGLGHGGRLVCGDALSPPFAAETFSTVLLTFPSEYVSAPRFLKEAARILRPGGRLVVLVGAEAGTWPWPGLLERALRWLTDDSAWRPLALGPPEHAMPARWPDAGLVGRYLDERGPKGALRLLVAAKETAERG